jgi:hypothetical protein
VNSAEARRIVAELGLTERVRQNIAAMPPLTAEQVKLIRRILSRAGGLDTSTHRGRSHPQPGQAASRNRQRPDPRRDVRHADR